jgi:hypothetical protein
MFCPQCSAQNDGQQKFCRQCGLPLTAVRLAFEGRTEEALERSRKGKSYFVGAGLTLALCTLAALLNIFLASMPWALYLVIANLVVGLAVAVPTAIAGYLNLSRAERALNPANQSGRRVEPGPQSSNSALPPAQVTDPVFSGSLPPGSVTEQTTLNLRRPESES